MEKTFLLHLSAHWGDLIEQMKKNLSYTLEDLFFEMFEEIGVCKSFDCYRDRRSMWAEVEA